MFFSQKGQSMKLQIVLFAAAMVLGGVAEAQTAAPAGTAATPTVTPEQQANRDRIKGERETCRTQAQSQGLKGDAVRTAVMDCMTKTDPVVAKRMACAQAGKAKNLSGDDLKKSVHACMTAG